MTDGRTAAKARFCACQFEAIKPGAYVYVKARVGDEPATLTTNPEEADAHNTAAVGTIEGAAFKLNAHGEELLRDLE